MSKETKPEAPALSDVERAEVARFGIHPELDEGA